MTFHRPLPHELALGVRLGRTLGVVLQFLRRHLPEKASHQIECFIRRVSPLDKMASDYSTCSAYAAPAMNVDRFAEALGVCQDPLNARHLAERRNAKVPDRKANVGDTGSTGLALIT